MKDLSQLQTLLSIVFNWGIDPLLSRALPTVTKKPVRSSGVPPDAHIIDLTTANEDFTLLFEITNRLLNIILPEGPLCPSATTHVALTVLNHGFADLLRSCICLGWLPNDVRSDIPSALNLKPFVSRLSNGFPPAQSMTALGSIMRKHTKPLYISRICKILLTEQLLRPDGVAGLFSSVFGEDVSSSEAPLEELQSTSDVLNALPRNFPPEQYYPIMIPRLLHLLSPGMDNMTPPSHRRAAAFALSRMLTTRKDEDDKARPDIRQSDASPTFASEDQLSKAQSIAKNALVLPPSQAVPTLSTILMNTDPSPELIDVLLQPITPQLYALLEYYRLSRIADPVMRSTIEGLLNIWARAAEKREVVDALWKIVEGNGGEWDVDNNAELRVFRRSVSLPSLSITQLADLQEGKLEMEGDEENNPLNLNPHPLHFAKFLKSLKREDVASALYLRILDTHVKLDDKGNPLRKLLLFQLSMKISEQVGADAPADSPLRRPDVTRTLMIIKMTLAQEVVVGNAKGRREGGLSLESLRIVPEEGGEGGESDSDDEDLAPGLEGVNKREHLSVTAVNLLIALLEEHPDLSPRTVPLLNDIYEQLEPLANSDSEALRPRAREARIILTARLASSSSFPVKGDEQEGVGEESPREKYQRALKLLQDPLLPVRAHGLLLLRELVAPASTAPRRRDKDKAGGSATVSTVQGVGVAAPSVDVALVPGILSIFMQSIQDEDSYIFLNAVQGLAALVDGFGQEVLLGLLDEYAKGLEGVGGSEATMTTREVDLRVRIGEALGQVIKRCGGALGKYVDIIVPRLFAVVRASHLPTTLRTSAVSLLATATDTNALALNSYSVDLIGTMVDLVQIESSGANLIPRRRATVGASREALSEIEGEEVTMDTRPTVSNPKFPPLRRAALHFLLLLIRGLTSRV
ncbi:uncharacterized protein FOMMEDRAFT_126746, partial [Fomitiporia mediterranea MF3/22]|uniref:uncharacterized protein n=1 Tax=Fomitiporia mediterranea (strain MF3/22) TaxID=694068 RepID=UPI0004408FA2